MNSPTEVVVSFAAALDLVPWRPEEGRKRPKVLDNILSKLGSRQFSAAQAELCTATLSIRDLTSPFAQLVAWRHP